MQQYEKFIRIKVGHNVNFRNQPVVDSKNVIGTCPAGEVLQTFEVQGTWAFAKRVSNGQTGWITIKDEYVENFVPDWLADAIEVVEYGEQYLGKPYVFGSSRSTDVSFDCSDFTKWNYSHTLGTVIPSDSRSQSLAGIGIGTGYDVLRTGDLIFFDTNKDGIVNHVAIYVYPNKILHTYNTTCDIYNRDMVKVRTGGGGVTYSKYEDGTSWRKNTTGARRIINK